MLKLVFLLICLVCSASCILRHPQTEPLLPAKDIEQLFKARLPDTNQRDVSLHPPEEGLVVFHFFATWCQICREDMAVSGLSQIPLPHRVVHISLDAQESEARKTLLAAGMQHHSLVMDAEGRLLQALGGEAIPLTLVFNSRGLLKAYSRGSLKPEHLTGL